MWVENQIFLCRAHKIFSSENGFSTQGQNWADGDGDNVIIIMVREAILSKKCSFFEHCSNGGGSTHVQKLCRKLSCVLEVI